MEEVIEIPLEIIAIIYAELPAIDLTLSEANIAISSRADEAFKIIQETMIGVSDYKAFILSVAHGKLRIIVGEWFKERYGKIAEIDEEIRFEAAILIHATPFIMCVPKNFRIAGDEPNTWWVGFPASVQKEENALDWIQNREVVVNLSNDLRNEIKVSATNVANLIKSIWFDLHALTYEKDEKVCDLASSIMIDLKNCALNLCERNDAGQRSSLWNASQATEKAIKLFISRKGEPIPFSHDLSKLADRSESLGAVQINRNLLGLVPSNSDATSIRYGGKVRISTSIEAYNAALHIVRDLAYECRPTGQYNIRELRLKIKHPTWFDFDMVGFKKKLKSTIASLKK